MTVLSPTKWSISEKSDKALIEFVQRIRKLTEPISREADRRLDKRTAFPHLITLTPIDDQELRVAGEQVTVVGKQLAGRGLDFYHTGPLRFKRAIVSFDSKIGIDANFVLSISWCRFLRPGWYDSGGRFTNIVRPDFPE